MAGADDARTRNGDGGFFEPHGTTMSPARRRMFAAFEIIYTLVDFTAATAFITGSVMFFWQNWQTAGTWLFLAGSVLFAVKPTLRLVKELTLVSRGCVENVAKRAGG